MMTVYSKTDRPDLLFQSAGYVAKHHPHPASVSITIRSLITSVRRLEWPLKLIERYEAALKENPKDRAAFMIMESHEYLVTRKSLYQWHRGLGEVFLYTRHRELAIQHLTSAKEDARIDVYRDQCSELLDLANALR